MDRLKESPNAFVRLGALARRVDALEAKVAELQQRLATKATAPVKRAAKGKDG